jgi:hypothetical protein
VSMLASASACSSFSGEVVGPDAAAPAEGSVADSGTDLGPMNDAAVDGPVFSCTASLCEDFETDSWRKDWQKAGATIIDVNADGPASSGTRAATLRVAASTPGILVHSLGAAKQVSFAANMIIVEKGDGEIDFINLVEGAQPGAPGFHISHSGTNLNYNLEVPKIPTRALGQTFVAYQRVKLEVNLVAHTYKFSAGNEVVQGELDPTFPAQPLLYISLGAGYATGIKKAWHVRFDDVEITTN